MPQRIAPYPIPPIPPMRQGGVRRAGGPYKGGKTFRFIWEGARVTKQVDDATFDALKELAAEIEAWMQANLHVKTGEMKEKSFAAVTIKSGRRVLTWGSDAQHTLWHEFGTRWYPAHPQFREIGKLFIPRVTPTLKAALAKQGTR